MQEEIPGVVAALPPQRLLRFPAVRARTCLGPTATYALIKRGEFPAPIKVGAASLWVEAEILAWMAARVADRDAARAGQAVAT